MGVSTKIIKAILIVLIFTSFIWIASNEFVKQQFPCEIYLNQSIASLDAYKKIQGTPISEKLLIQSLIQMDLYDECVIKEFSK
jgi:hypothetical protein